MCGHATLATAHAMAADGLVERQGAGSAASAGSWSPRSGEDQAITLDFPVSEPTASSAPEGLATALGTEPVAVHRTDPLGDLLVGLADEATVRAAVPDLGMLAEVTERDGFRGTIMTAPAGARI